MEHEALEELEELQGLDAGEIDRVCLDDGHGPCAGSDADLDLDESATLDEVLAARRASWRAEARLLWMVAHLADQHAVLDPVPVDGDLSGRRQRRESGREALVRVAAGVPGYAEFLAADVAAQLMVGCGTAHRLIGDALIMRHRLPRLWTLMMGGRIAPWHVRRVVSAPVIFPSRHQHGWTR